MFRRSAPKKPQIIQEMEPSEKTEVSVFLHKKEPVIPSADKVLINSNSTPKLSVSTNPDRIQSSICICMLIGEDFGKYLTRVKENLSFLQSGYRSIDHPSGSRPNKVLHQGCESLFSREMAPR